MQFLRPVATRHLKAAALVLALVLGHTPATRAAEMTGNSLLSDCTSNYPYRVGMCRGYILGAASMLQWGHPTSVSIPETVIDQQLADIVTKWLKNNPKLRHRDGLEVVLYALVEAFPAQPKAAAKP